MLSKAMGGLNVLVNNAGIIRQSPVVDTSEEDWDLIIRTNLKSVFLCTKRALKITYDEPDNSPFPENSAHDMVIIAPSEFSADLQELVDHKNSFGVNTILKTTEDIYSEYSGVDKPEQIKYFIKDER